MKEHFTPALVLDLDDSGELDRIVHLYTKALGKIRAKAKSIRKITSKQTGHLQPLNFVRIRLVEKNGFQVADAVFTKQLERTKGAIDLLQFIKEMTFELQPDKKLWVIIKKSFADLKAKKFSYKPLLETLGFDPKFATCNTCAKNSVIYFSIKEQVFLCKNCSSKISKNELILI